jgi:D-glycero-beta-D-manno-heptose-7-phosphate kinase
MLDEYVMGDADRISPEAPVPIVRIRERRYALGGAANVAQNVVAIGASCDLLGAVGDDVAGKVLRRMLADAELSPSGLVTAARPTTLKTRVVARAQQLVRIDVEDDASLDVYESKKLRESFDSVITGCDALILEDYDKGVLEPSFVEHAIACARKLCIPVVVDPKYRNFFAFRGATVFKPNRRELEAAFGADTDWTHDTALSLVREKLRVENLILTVGERGMLLVAPGRPALAIPTTAREVFDVVGAGDTVTAYLATMLASGASVDEAAVIANYAAGVQVRKFGAATVTPNEVLAAFEQSEAPSRI